MHHLLKHINQEDKDSTVNKTEYRSKRNPTGKPQWAPQTAKESVYLPEPHLYHVHPLITTDSHVLPYPQHCENSQNTHINIGTVHLGF